MAGRRQGKAEGEKRETERRDGRVETTSTRRTGLSKLAAVRPSPLDQVKGITTATADLREGNGNLSAVRVAKLYGVSLSQLAGWLGRTKQAVSKTPDADSV
jgi:hypothetical protein